MTRKRPTARSDNGSLDGAAVGGGRGEDGQATREALMDAALSLLERHGVLAGLNITEVAKEVGVTPANIYHYFHSRQGLLRAAINHRMVALAGEKEREKTELRWAERTLAGFEFMRAHPEISLLSLLALDEDEEFNIAPFLDAARSVIKRDTANGHILPGIDAEVMHMLLLTFGYGYGIFAAGAARQLDMNVEEFHARAGVVLRRMVSAFADMDTPPA